MFEKKKSVWLFLLPGLAMLMIFYIVPFFSGIGYSLTDGSYKNAFVGLQNYRDLWGNSMFLLGLKNTMELSLICAPLLWVFSFLLASALSAIKPFGGFFRSSVLMPYLTPSSAILLVWLVIFDYGGPVNRMLEAMGMERVMWRPAARCACGRTDVSVEEFGFLPDYLPGGAANPFPSRFTNTRSWKAQAFSPALSALRCR